MSNEQVYVVGIKDLESRIIGVYKDFESAEKMAIEESLYDDFDEETYENHYVKTFLLGKKHSISEEVYMNGEKGVVDY